MQRFSPWKRKRPVTSHSCSAIEHTFKGKFDDNYTHANIDLDIYTKRAALKACASVVSIVSFIGEEFLFAGSGIIIDSEYVNGTYFSTILTSASLLRSSPDIDVVPDCIKVNVYLPDDKLCEGQIFAFDFHYNLATIKIESIAALPAATIKLLDDSLSLDPRRTQCPAVADEGVVTPSFQLRPHSNLFKLCPGDMVVAVGRCFEAPYELMVAPGKFSADCSDFDCKELFVANCKISKSGIGGPLVNRYGEVIGVNFYGYPCTPFLPINIASKCFEHFKKFGKLCPPWLGLEMTNLYSANIGNLDAIIKKFPNIFEGVFVEKVTPGSPADSAGIHPGDVIVQCGKDLIWSFLQLYGKIWDTVGESVEVVVIRESTGVQLNLTVLVGETSPHNFNRWPIPEQCFIPVNQFRSR